LIRFVTRFQIKQRQSGWWKGEAKGQIGKFPRNFVKAAEKSTSSDSQALAVEFPVTPTQQTHPVGQQPAEVDWSTAGENALTRVINNVGGDDNGGAGAFEYEVDEFETNIPPPYLAALETLQEVQSDEAVFEEESTRGDADFVEVWNQLLD
jgi:hypothetical protein